MADDFERDPERADVAPSDATNDEDAAAGNSRVPAESTSDGSETVCENGVPEGPDSDADSTAASQTKVLDNPCEDAIPDVEPTVERPIVDETAERHSVADSESPQDDATAKRPRIHKPKRRRVVLLAILAIAVVGIAALVGVSLTGVPDKASVSADALERVSIPVYDGGTFGASSALSATSAKVTSRSHVQEAPSDDDKIAGATGYAQAEVIVTFTGDSVYAEKSAVLTYASVNGSWVGVGDETDAEVAWTATAGVDQDKVLENISAVLDRAEQTLDEDEDATTNLTLVGLYATGDVTILSESFDADEQTDTLKIACARTYEFESYSCELTVTFKFRPGTGAWEIQDVGVSEGSKTHSYEPLESSWTGDLADATSAEGKPTCSGAALTGLTVKVESVTEDESDTTMQAAFTGTVHYHGYPEKDASSTDGDVELEDVEFTATLLDGTDEVTGSNLAFTGTVVADDDTLVSITIGFGTEDDASAITAVVTTTYTYTETLLFIPYDKTVTYTDTYSLT